MNSSFVLESQSVCSICSHFVIFAYNLHLRIHLWEILPLLFKAVSRSGLGVGNVKEECKSRYFAKLYELIKKQSTGRSPSFTLESLEGTWQVLLLFIIIIFFFSLKWSTGSMLLSSMTQLLTHLIWVKMESILSPQGSRVG